MRLRAGILVTPLRATTGGAATLPERLLILPWGTSTDLDGDTYLVNEATVRELAANQTRNGFDEVALDFAHNTFLKDDKGQIAPTPEPVKVAAYGTLSVVEGEGIYLTPTSWTKEGEEHYLGGHYKDLSPVPGKNAAGEVIFVHSVALCRQGQLAGLHALSANLPTDQPKQPTTKQPTTMDNDTIDFRQLTARLLGLEEDASEEAILAAVEEHDKKAKADPDDGTALSAQDRAAATAAAPATAAADAADDADADDAAQATGALKPLSIDQRLDLLEKQRLVDNAVREGKVVPLSAADLPGISLASLSAIIDRIEPTVPLDSRTHGGAQGDRSTLKALSPEERQICKNLGISEEDYRKANADAA